MSASRPARGALALLAMTLLVGCASVPEAPVVAPTSEPPRSTADPTAQPTATPGAVVVPLACEDAMPELVDRHEMTLDEAPAFTTERAMHLTAGLLECGYASGPGELSAYLLVFPEPSPEWVDHLRSLGAVGIDGGVEERSCWGDVAEAYHCSVRWQVGAYAAELYLNSPVGTAVAGESLDGAAVEVRSMLSSLDDPLARGGASEVDEFRSGAFCDRLALEGSTVAGEIPWVAQTPNHFGGDGPWIDIESLRRTGAATCGWSEAAAGAQNAYDNASVTVVPGAGWAFDRLAPGARADLPGADEASAALGTDERDRGVEAYARVGDDLVHLELTDSDLNGLIAEDQPSLGLRLLESIVTVLVADGIIG